MEYNPSWKITHHFDLKWNWSPVTQFGIALPKWIVEGKNSYLVLGVYVLIFMIILPIVVVSVLFLSHISQFFFLHFSSRSEEILIFLNLNFKGTWWYRSIKFTGDQLLLITNQIYKYFLSKHVQLNTKSKDSLAKSSKHVFCFLFYF